MIITRNAPLDERPPLGGWRPGIALTDTQRAVLEAVADQLIPGGDGFPAPSEAGVANFMVRYIAPAGQPAKWYPFLEESDVKLRLDDLGETFVGSSHNRQIEVLHDLENNEPEFFGRIRDLVYHAYYSRPSVVAAINRTLPGGRDLRVAPQPYGYSDTIIDWDDDLLDRVRGTYKRTEDVVRLELPPTIARMSAARARGERLSATGFKAEEVTDSAAQVRSIENRSGA